MSLPSIILSISKRVGALLLGGVILWQVVEHSGPTSATAIIHVATTPSEIAVDEDTYHVESIFMTPLVCEVRPGRHMLRMLQEGRVLYEEPFLLKPGEEVVLVAWDPDDPSRRPAEAGPERDGVESVIPESAHHTASHRRSKPGPR
jgi:hypothetical protein